MRRILRPNFSSSSSQRPQSREQAWRSEFDVIGATAIVYGAVFFNAGLAFINANIFSLTSAPVIACEVLLDACALIFCLRVRSPLITSSAALFLILVLINVLSAIGNAHFDPKFLRDVIIVPLFASLGLAVGQKGIVRLITPMQIVVLAVMIFEALRPEEFGRFLNIMGYYINTRGFEETSFWSQNNPDLFVSATRPGERFLFQSLNIHRLSSVFLEPVSLGNYTVIVAMICAATWSEIGSLRRLFFVLSTALLLIGSDGRLATVNIAVILVLRLSAKILPRYANVAILPALLLGSAVAVSLFRIDSAGDDFGSRTAGSIQVLSEMNLPSLFSFEAAHAYAVMDSGISYLLYSQSLIGACAIWLFISCGFPQSDKPTKLFAYMASFYCASNFLVSYSVFSVKTAGLLWFAYGAVANRAAQRRSVVAPVAAPKPTLRSAFPIERAAS